MSRTLRSTLFMNLKHHNHWARCRSQDTAARLRSRAKSTLIDLRFESFSFHDRLYSEVIRLKSQHRKIIEETVGSLAWSRPTWPQAFSWPKTLPSVSTRWNGKLVRWSAWLDTIANRGWLQKTRYHSNFRWHFTRFKAEWKGTWNIPAASSASPRTL